MIVKRDEKHPQGIAWPCKCRKEAIERQKYENLMKIANIYNDQHMTFDNYRPTDPSQQRALEIMRARHGGYFLFGAWGTGKTHLVTATVLRAINEGTMAVRISVPRLLKEIRKFGRDNTLDIEIMAQEIPYLALDDIGKQKDTDWTEERLFDLVDHRYQGFVAGKTLTSITSNLPLKAPKGRPEMEVDTLSRRLDGAIIDRIEGMCRILMVLGESYRSKKGDMC